MYAFLPLPDRASRALASVTALLAASCLAPTLQASDHKAISSDCEVAIALSAAPARLREDASVLVHVDGRYERLREGTGPLTCIVERNHPQALIPQCLDREGAATILPAIVDRSLLALAGKPLAEIRADNQHRHAAGDYQPPSRAGISYMMSDYNYIYVGSAGGIQKVAPHVMFYAPNLDDDDIGGSFRSMFEHRGTPAIVDPGPHGYMVVYTDGASDSSAVNQSCKGQLDAAPPEFNPFKPAAADRAEGEMKTTTQG